MKLKSWFHLMFALHVVKSVFFLGIITVNPPEIRPVYALLTRGLKLYTLPTGTSIRYPFVTHLTPAVRKHIFREKQT